jgi:hypothetical protein
MRSRLHGSQVSLDLSLVLDADGSTPVFVSGSNVASMSRLYRWHVAVYRYTCELTLQELYTGVNEPYELKYRQFKLGTNGPRVLTYAKQELIKSEWDKIWCSSATLIELYLLLP